MEAQSKVGYGMEELCQQLVIEPACMHPHLCTSVLGFIHMYIHTCLGSQQVFEGVTMAGWVSVLSLALTLRN